MIQASAKFDVTFESKQTASHTRGFREACDRSTIGEAALGFTRRVGGFFLLSTTEKGLLAKPCRSFGYLFVWLLPTSLPAKVGPTWSLLSRRYSLQGQGPTKGAKTHLYYCFAHIVTFKVQSLKKKKTSYLSFL